MSRPQLVVFDIAGTTVRDQGNVARCFMDAFAASGYTVRFEDAQKVMGYKKTDAIRDLLLPLVKREPDPAEIDRIHSAFNEKMIGFYETTADLKPFPDSEPLFIWLKSQGVRTGLNTGFIKPVTDAVLGRLGWKVGETIDAVVSSDEVANGRPSADMIHRMMASLGITDPKSVVKVGDTESDINEGRNAGCGMVVSVTTGAYSRESLAGFHPDRIIDGIGELKELLKPLL